MSMRRTNILDRFLDPIGSLLTPDVAERLVEFRADARTQKRLDRLAEKSRQGKLTAAERKDYETYVSAIDFVTVLQSKARSLLRTQAKGR